MKVKDHYDKHLGNFYSWMAGDFQLKQNEQQTFFQKHKIKPGITGYAVDLGAGHGLQTIALANLGFKVKAVDFNKQLLEELRINSQALPVEIFERDILQFLQEEKITVDVVACMGDTLTHLPSVSDVERLVNLSSQRLTRNGTLIFSFRDLTSTLTGTQRFIPVKQDDRKILTCFLEYFSDHVMVHDILHEKTDHRWVQKVSAYPKLRINAAMVSSLLEKNGFDISSVEEISRMLYIVAAKKY